MLNESMVINILFAGTLLLLVAFVVRAMCRRGVEKSLREQNLFLQKLINSIPSPVFYKNREGVYIGCNDAFLEMLGKTRSEVVGQTVYGLSPKELAEVYEKADNDLFEDGGEQRYETQVKFADGSLHNIFFTKAVFRDSNDEVAGLLGVMLDVTDRKVAEEELTQAHAELERRVQERTAELAKTNESLEREVAVRKRAELDSRKKSEFLDTIINSINHGIIVIDADDMSIKLTNRAAAGGRSCGDSHCFDFLHGHKTPCNQGDGICPVKAVKKTREPVVAQHDHLMPNGESSYVEIHAYPVFDENGEVVQVIENIMDITSRKEAEQAMLEAKEMAETTSRLMSEFLDTVSHELRTPMTSVHGFAKLIDKKFAKHFEAMGQNDAVLEKEVGRIKGNLDIIIAESERLTELINDHLDLSKLESGRVDWRNESIDPVELLERARAATSSLLADSPVDMVLESPEGLPSFTGDPDRLLQVMINIISNAVKFTAEGNVTCSVSLQGDHLRFSVQDTGIGIPEDQYQQIFSKFSQLQTKKSGKPSGTGLGLAISKQIVEHYGGRIWVKSTLGEGSTFFFTMPVE